MPTRRSGSGLERARDTPTAGLAAYARPHGDRRRPRRDPGPRGGRARTRVAPRPERRCGRPSSGMGNREPDRPPRERLPRARRGRGSRRGAGECLRALGRRQRDRPRGAVRLGRPRRRPGRGGAAAWPRDRRGLARHAVRGHAPLADRRARTCDRGAVAAVLHPVGAGIELSRRVVATSRTRTGLHGSCSPAHRRRSPPGSATTRYRSRCASAHRLSSHSSSRDPPARPSSSAARTTPSDPARGSARSTRPGRSPPRPRRGPRS